MVSQKSLFSIIFVVVALCVMLGSAVPILGQESETPSQRQGRFYGFGGASASASASASAGGFGGFPYGGFGGANAFAMANANSFTFGK